MSFGHARDFMRLMSQASLHFMKKTTLETCLANMPEHAVKNLQGKQSESSNAPDYVLIYIKGTTQDICLVLSLIISLIFHPEFLSELLMYSEQIGHTPHWQAKVCRRVYKLQKTENPAFRSEHQGSPVSWNSTWDQSYVQSETLCPCMIRTYNTARLCASAT